MRLERPTGLLPLSQSYYIWVALAGSAPPEPMQMPESLRYTSLHSALGLVWAARTKAGLRQLAVAVSEAEFLERLPTRRDGRPVHDPDGFSDLREAMRAYFSGLPPAIDLPLDLGDLSTFSRRVLLALGDVPPGSVVTYGELASRLGQPNAARAVGNALARNPLPILLPCHRVVPANGGLGGYTGGIDLKRRLLALEGWTPLP